MPREASYQAFPTRRSRGPMQIEALNGKFAFRAHSSRQNCKRRRRAVFILVTFESELFRAAARFAEAPIDTQETAERG